MTSVPSAQFLQQRFGLLQVFGVKTYGEPAIELSQYRAGFCSLPLLVPQPAQTHPRAELQGFCSLLLSDLDGLVKAHFGLRLGSGNQVLGIRVRLLSTGPGLVLGWRATRVRCLGDWCATGERLLEHQLALETVHLRRPKGCGI